MKEISKATFRKINGKPYKLRTNKATAARFSITGTGKVRRTMCGRQHNTGDKPRSVITRLGGTTITKDNMSNTIKRLLGLR
jgi:ribosomal protein L35